MAPVCNGTPWWRNHVSTQPHLQSTNGVAELCGGNHVPHSTTLEVVGELAKVILEFQKAHCRILHMKTVVRR